MKNLISLSLSLLLPALALASNVLVLTDDNFDSHIGQSKGALVEFYAPWCGHCKNLAPTYDQLADVFQSKDVIIAKTDADGEGKQSGSRFGVRGYPTLKWFPAGSLEPVDYNSGRDLDSLIAFVTEQTGIKSKVKAPPPSAILELTPGNFDEVALDESKGTLVAFTAPWCGHCKSLKPILEKVAADFKNEPDCVVAQMNADDQINKPIANRYAVKSYPTIKYFPSGLSKSVDFQPDAYESGRTEEAFVKFLNEACGTSRVAGGGLSDVAGLIHEFDAIAGSLFNPIFASALSTLVAKAEALAPSFLLPKQKASSDYYLRVIKKVDALGEHAKEWITREKTRLGKLAASPSLASTKKDELQIKANILSSFLSERASSAWEKAEEVVGDVKDKVEEAVEDVKERVREEL